MRVLTLIANPWPKSFCTAIVGSSAGVLRTQVTPTQWCDLYAINFDRVLRWDDFASQVHESMPPEILEAMNLKQRVLDSAGNPIVCLVRHCKYNLLTASQRKPNNSIEDFSRESERTPCS